MVKITEEEAVNLKNATLSWLEELRDTPLPKDVTLCELLSDGKLLATTAAALQESAESTEVRLKFQNPGSKNIAGWSKFKNIEHFRNVCLALGVSERYILTPTDIIHNQDEERICQCFQELAKCSKALGIAVPDFKYRSTEVLQSSVTGIVSSAKREIFEKSHYSLQENIKKTTPQRFKDVNGGSPSSNPVQEKVESPLKPEDEIDDPGCCSKNNPDDIFHTFGLKDGRVILGAGCALVIGIAFLLRIFKKAPTYHVQKGDTLIEIARKTGRVDWKQLKQKNKELANPDLIFPSQRLQL